MNPTLLGALLALVGTLLGVGLTILSTLTQQRRTQWYERETQMRHERREAYARFLTSLDVLRLALQQCKAHSSNQSWNGETESHSVAYRQALEEVSQAQRALSAANSALRVVASSDVDAAAHAVMKAEIEPSESLGRSRPSPGEEQLCEWISRLKPAREAVIKAMRTELGYTD